MDDSESEHKNKEKKINMRNSPNREQMKFHLKSKINEVGQ